MPDLRRRSLAPELMDGDDVAQEDFAACMADLAAVNTVTLARLPTLAFVRRAWSGLAPEAVPTILDVGFGAGDMLRSIRGMLKRSGRDARLIGIDLNPRSQPAADAMTPAGAGIEYQTGDAFALYPEGNTEHAPDLIISSLVTHHMTDTEIVDFVRWMEATAKRGWFVNDLHRHWVPYLAFIALSTLARWHRFVRHDGPLSIARSFSRHDWQRLLTQAGVAGTARIRWRFPFRYCVERTRW